MLDGRPGSAVVRIPLVVSLDPDDRAVTRIRRGAAGHRPTVWYHDEIRRPAMGRDVAEGLWRIASWPPDRRTGPWHLPGPERLNRYDIARRITDTLGLDPASVVSAPAPRDGSRPRDIDLCGDRARAEIDWNPNPVLR